MLNLVLVEPRKKWAFALTQGHVRAYKRAASEKSKKLKETRHVIVCRDDVVAMCSFLGRTVFELRSMSKGQAVRR